MNLLIAWQRRVDTVCKTCITQLETDDAHASLQQVAKLCRSSADWWLTYSTTRLTDDRYASSSNNTGNVRPTAYDDTSSYLLVISNVCMDYNWSVSLGTFTLSMSIKRKCRQLSNDCSLSTFMINSPIVVNLWLWRCFWPTLLKLFTLVQICWTREQLAIDTQRKLLSCLPHSRCRARQSKYPLYRASPSQAVQLLLAVTVTTRPVGTQRTQYWTAEQ
jgi:hypothetical protein